MALDSFLTRTLLLVALAAVVTACGSDDNGGPADNRIQAVITQADPLTGFAPLEVRFVASVEAIAEDANLEEVVYTWDFGDAQSATGGTVTHAFQQAGAFVVTVTAEEREGEAVRSTATATTTIDVLPPADLAVGAPVVNPPAVDSSTPLRVSVDLSNLASAIPEGNSFDLSIYLGDPEEVSEESPPGVDDIAVLVASGAAHNVHTESFTSFEGDGAQQNVDVRDILIDDEVPSGTYNVFAFVDPDGGIGELDEDNNVAFASLAVTFTNTSQEGPDLQVVDVTAFPSRTDAIRTITYNATILNSGTEPALLFDYGVYLSAGDRTFDDDDTRIGGAAVENVSPGTPLEIEDAEITLDEPVVTLGEYYLLVVADDGETVGETNEGNNVGPSSGALVVTDEPIPGVDIRVDTFTVAPDSTYLEGSVELTVNVVNQGVERVDRQFICRVYLSEDDNLDTAAGEDQLLESFSVQPIDAGMAEEVVRVADIPGFFDPGEFFPIVFCDASQSIAESNEDNNVTVAESPIDIAVDAIVDLRVETFEIDPTEVDNEGMVTVTVEICNDGSNGSTPSVVRVQLSQDPELDIGDTQLLRSQVPPINPMSCITIEGEVPAICDTFVSSYTAIALVDATNVVPELSEENNIAILPDPVTINGLICDCELDDFEPNNSPGTAAVIDPEGGTYESMTMCDSANDWFRIPLLRGETIRATATFDSDRGDLEMILYGTDFATVLAESNTNGDREEVAFFRVPERGDYLLGVSGVSADDRNVYDLTLDVSSPAEGTDLTVLNVRTNRESPVLGEEIEVDFDVVNLGDTPAEGPFVNRIYLSEDADIDPVDDFLLGQIDIDAVVDRVSREVTVTLPDDVEGGPRYIGVIADARDDVTGELDEENNVGVSGQFNLDAGCFDALEPNNSLDAPRLLDLVTEPPVTLAGLLVCSDNRDFYEICLDDGDFLSVSVQFDNGLGDVDAKLYNEAGAEIQRAEGIGSEELLEVDFVSGDQCYRVEVYVSNPGAEVPYQLIVDSGRAPDELQCNNAGEPNGGFGTAAPLRDYLDRDLAVCPDADEDHFRIELAAGTTITLGLDPADGEDAVPSSLRMRLSGPSRNFLANTVRADERIEHRVATGGTHYVRVRSNGDGPRNQPYRLFIDGISGTDLVPSELTLDPMVAAPGQRVRYSFELSNTRDIDASDVNYRIYLSDDPVLEPELDWLVRNDTNAGDVAGLSQVLAGGKFTVPDEVDMNGTYYVILVIDPDDDIDEIGETNNIDLEPLAVTGLCFGDLAEPNDFAFDAADVDDVAGETLTVCSGDVDWFATDFADGDVVTVSVSGGIDQDGDIDLNVYFDDPVDGLVLVGFSDELGNDESVTFDADDTGTYRIEVLPFEDAANVSYSLDVTVE